MVGSVGLHDKNSDTQANTHPSKNTAAGGTQIPPAQLLLGPHRSLQPMKISFPTTPEAQWRGGP